MMRWLFCMLCDREREFIYLHGKKYRCTKCGKERKAL